MHEMSDDDTLPDPRPALRAAPLIDHSFAALGWLNRASVAVGSTRFDECVQRVEFNLRKAAAVVKTPGDRVVVDGLAASLAEMVRADAEARQLFDGLISEG